MGLILRLAEPSAYPAHVLWKIATGVLGVALVSIIVVAYRFISDVQEGFDNAFGYPSHRRRR